MYIQDYLGSIIPQSAVKSSKLLRKGRSTRRSTESEQEVAREEPEGCKGDSQNQRAGEGSGGEKRKTKERGDGWSQEYRKQHVGIFRAESG